MLFTDKRVLSEKIKDQIIEYIALGVYEEGMMLASVRMYANSLGINPNTVQKAYQKLEEEGHIISIAKKGSFVKDVDFSRKVFSEQLLLQTKQLVNKLYKLGMDESQIRTLLKKEGE